jgi:putative ABC transport system ATP-binding protein
MTTENEQLMTEVTELRAEEITVHGAATVFVRDLSLVAHPGEIVGITGPSGSGKTSLLHALGGLQVPDHGRVLLNGEPVTLWQQPRVALILQTLWLLPVLSVWETVALPLQAHNLPREEVETRVDEAITALGLADHRAQLVSELSGGQRQRVAGARAFAARADVILADEPGSSLDPHWRSMLFEQIRAQTARGAIVLLATSDPDTLTLCDQLITLAGTADATT